MPTTSLKYLFFDTETTGIPQNYKAPCTDTDNWPRLVQLGWILTDGEGQELGRGNRIVRPDGSKFPQRHRMSTASRPNAPWQKENRCTM